MSTNVECRDCHKPFPSGARALQQHCDAVGHLPMLHSCGDIYCNDTFYTELARNEHEYDDHDLCGDCDRYFTRTNSLNQVRPPLDFPDQQVLYHCPNRHCDSEFKSLAGIMNHLESESCQFMRFEAVQTQMNNLVHSTRLLAF